MVTLSPISHCYLNSFGWEKKNLKQKIVKYLLFLWNKIKSKLTNTFNAHLYARTQLQTNTKSTHTPKNLTHTCGPSCPSVGRSVARLVGRSAIHFYPIHTCLRIHINIFNSKHSFQNKDTRTHTHTHTYICIYTHFFKLRYSQISKDKTEIYFSGTVLNQYFFLTCQQQHTFVWFIHDIQGYRVSQNDCGIRKFFCVNMCYDCTKMLKKCNILRSLKQQ